jgi:hypothetical protein
VNAAQALRCQELISPVPSDRPRSGGALRPEDEAAAAGR